MKSHWHMCVGLSIHFVHRVFACWVAVREELPREKDESQTAFVPPLDFWTSRWIKSKYFLWGRRDRMESTLLLRGFSPREAVKEDLKITLDFEKYVKLSIFSLHTFLHVSLDLESESDSYFSMHCCVSQSKNQTCQINSDGSVSCPLGQVKNWYEPCHGKCPATSYQCRAGQSVDVMETNCFPTKYFQCRGYALCQDWLHF